MQLQGCIETIEFGQVRLIREKDQRSVFGYGIIFNGRIFWGWAERLQKKRMKLLSRIRVTEHPEKCFAVVVIGNKIEMLVALTEQEIFFFGALLARVMHLSKI